MVPVNKDLLTGTVPVNEELLTGKVPVTILFQKKIVYQMVKYNLFLGFLDPYTKDQATRTFTRDQIGQGQGTLQN